MSVENGTQKLETKAFDSKTSFRDLVASAQTDADI